MVAVTVALAPWLLALGVNTAETLPRGARAVDLEGGLLVLNILLPPLPYFPVLTGDAVVGWGLADGLDARVRYQTHAGLVHRLGPELRGRVLRAGAFSLAARLWPSAAIAGAYQDEVDLGVDLSTLFGAVATWRGAPWALSLDAGLTMQWLLYERFSGEGRLDDTPFPAFVELALSFEWPLAPDVDLTARLEHAVPLAPDDPFVIFGGYPRMLVGGSLAW